MNVIFISNYLNNHQIPLCRELYSRLEHFSFVATETMSEERLKLGWRINEAEHPYLVNAASMSREEMEKVLVSADVILLGDCRVDIYSFNLKPDVLVLYYRERMFKKSNKVGFLRRIKYYFHYHIKPRKYKTALLCASAYAPYDYTRVGAFHNKCFKWGYFPAVISTRKDELIASKSTDAVRIVWVGRLIDWKRTEDAVMLAARLKKAGYNFTLDIVGNGEREEEICRLISDEGCDDCVRMMGGLPQNEVGRVMAESDILLVTSNHNEGWGAVVNEGMAAACAVIASHGVGAAPYLIKNGENGLIYKCADVNSLYGAVVRCITDADFRRELGAAAYDTVHNEWSVATAASRLIEFIDYYLKNSNTPFSDGVLSCAEMIKNDWIDE